MDPTDHEIKSTLIIFMSNNFTTVAIYDFKIFRPNLSLVNSNFIKSISKFLLNLSAPNNVAMCNHESWHCLINTIGLLSSVALALPQVRLCSGMAGWPVYHH